MSTAPYRPKHCQALPGKECWECYEGFGGRSPRVSQATINTLREKVAWLAEAFLTSTKAGTDGHGYAIDLGTAAREYSDAINTQWREMTRWPFNFTPAPVVPETSGEELLDILGLGKPKLSEADIKSLEL